MLCIRTCGNGLVDTTSEPVEVCDPSSSGDFTTCDAVLCVAINNNPPDCGNNVVEDPETCEPPNTDICDSVCRLITQCGNGVVEGTEACDDGNSIDNDACKNDCTLSTAA